MPFDDVDRWVRTELPRHNEAILAGRDEPGALLSALSDRVLVDLPGPEELTPRAACQLLVALGLTGASVARHLQEKSAELRAHPAQTFRGLLVRNTDGTVEDSFVAYFHRVVAATGTGHCGRDSYASLVRWNVPTTVVEFDGQVLAVLPGVFDDGVIRTYTSDAGEAAFFELLKKSEALELATNELLQPIADGVVDILSPDGVSRASLAARTLSALQRLQSDFAARPAAAGGLRADHFMDVFRQFAVHWQPGDLPPSGAHDPEFLRRDLLLGIDYPEYAVHVRKIFPALLATERRMLADQIRVGPLTPVLLAALDLDVERLRNEPVDAIGPALPRHAALGAWYQMLTANARVAATHLMLAEKYLFKPQRRRDAAGIGDRVLVSNRRGTTGMDSPQLGRLARARGRHVLRFLDRLPRADLARLTGGGSMPAVSSAEVAAAVRFVPTVGDR